MSKFNKKLLRIALALLVISIIILICVADGVYSEVWFPVLSVLITFATGLTYAAIDDDD